MAEIKWVTPIATATAIAESEWKRELETVSAIFELWRKQHPHDTELDCGCFIAEDRAFVRDQPDTCGTCIGQLQSLERLMNNHSKSQRKQKRPYDLSTARGMGHLSPSIE